MGYVYRDLKPSNILVTHHGILCIYFKVKSSCVISDLSFREVQLIIPCVVHLNTFALKDFQKVKKTYRCKHLWTCGH